MPSHDDRVELAACLTVEQLGPLRFRVTGGAEPHLVRLGRAGAWCNCADYAYRRRPCKHLRALDRYLQRPPEGP